MHALLIRHARGGGAAADEQAATSTALPLLHGCTNEGAMRFGGPCIMMVSDDSLHQVHAQRMVPQHLARANMWYAPARAQQGAAPSL